MIYTIDNGRLRLEVNSLGAEMQRLSSCSGADYLWDGDSRYWRRHAPVLFPFVARLKDDRYRLGDREYSMPKHGFAPESEFEVYKQSGTELVLRLTDNEKTREYYPFAFEFRVGYRLEDWKLNIGYTVENTETFQWLLAHCQEYGFILRYPEDKQDITQVMYEPWHFRYVGVEAAEYMMENGLTLGEYLGEA